MSLWAERWFLARRFGRAQLSIARSHTHTNGRFDFYDQRNILRIARRDEAGLVPFLGRNDTTPPTRTRRQDAVIADLMRTWGRYEWGQSLEKLVSLHHDMGRAVSPTGLEPIGEASIGHRFESIQGERRSRHITTQTFEPAPIVGGNRHVGVQTHAALSHAARGDPGARLHAALFAIKRLDAIPETPPTLPCLGTHRDPRTDGSGREQSKQWFVRGQRVLTRIETAAFDDTNNSTSRTGQDTGHVLSLWRRERNEQAEVVDRAGIDPVEYEDMEMRRQVQRRSEALNESDRAVVPTRNPEEPPRPQSLVGEERTQEGPQDLGHQPCIPGTSVSKGIRKREYPLTEGHAGGGAGRLRVPTTSQAAVSAILRPPQDGQKPRHLQENATSRSYPHASQWTRKNP